VKPWTVTLRSWGLASPEGVLALAFTDSPDGARTLAYSSLHQRFEAISHSFSAQWAAWAKNLIIPHAPEEIRREAFLSAMVLTRISHRGWCIGALNER